MNENSEVNGTPTDSEKMDISEISDIVSPGSDQSLCEMVDNAGSASGFTSCESHPLDNAAILAATSRTTATTQETSPARASGSMDRVPLDRNLDLDTNLSAYNGRDAGLSPADSEEDASSVYAAEVADDYRDVRLRKETELGGFVLERRNSRRGRPMQAEFVESANAANRSLRVIAAPAYLQDLDQSSSTVASGNLSYDNDASLNRSEGKDFDRSQSEDSDISLNLSKTSDVSEAVRCENALRETESRKNGFRRDSKCEEDRSDVHSERDKVERSKEKNSVTHRTNSDGDISTWTNGNSVDCNSKESLGKTNDLEAFHVDSANPSGTSETSFQLHGANQTVKHPGNGTNVPEFCAVDRETGVEREPSSSRSAESANDQSESSNLRHLEVNVRVYDRAGSQTANQSGGRRRIRLSSSLMKDEAESSDESPDVDLDTLAGSGDELEDSIMERLSECEPIPELSAAEERADERGWRTCHLAGAERTIDMRVVEPYKRVLSHGGYLAAGSHNAIIIFSACFLPDRSRPDYAYVMDNLFFYVVSTLQQLVTQDYVLVYLHGATQRSCMPTFSWLKRCYQMLDRRLRKDLKALYLVHPTFWLKTLVLMTRPFISSKFSRKLSFVGSLEELRGILPLEQASIPDRVKQLDASLS